MVAKSLLIGYIAFNGAVPALNTPFGGGSPGVFGVRNINGFKGNGAGIYQLRIGGPALTGLGVPAQQNNEWSHAVGNTRVSVTLFGAAESTYSLVQLDDNTYNLLTYAIGAAADMVVQFSIETLATF